MKTILRKLFPLMLVVSCIVTVLSGCAQDVPDDESSNVGKNKLTPLWTNSEPVTLGTPAPVLYGPEMSSTSFAKSCTVLEAAQEAELVVELVITDWLGEDPELQKTYYKASVRTIYKNTIGFSDTTLILRQVGIEEDTFKDYPLFQTGETLLLSLKKSDMPVLDIVTNAGYSECYYICAARQSELRLYEINGHTYAVSSFKQAVENVTASLPVADRTTVVEHLSARQATYITDNGLSERIRTRDEINQDTAVFKLEDILTYLSEIAE